MKSWEETFRQWGTACAKVLEAGNGRWRNELQVHKWIVITEFIFIHLFTKTRSPSPCDRYLYLLSGPHWWW